MNTGTKPLGIVYFGTATFACPTLEKLAASPACTVLAVVSQPDRPKGRELRLLATPVKSTAQRLGLPVMQPEKARGEAFIHDLRQLQPDLIVVAAYGQILPSALLDLPRYGALNVHGSLLPKYRGAAPIQWAILDGEPVTGVTIMKMDPGLDTGPILTQAETAIEADENTQTLHDRLANLGADLLLATVPRYVGGEVVPRPQPEAGATYARKLKKEDGRIDWGLPAQALHNRVRALSPWPGAFSALARETGKVPLKIWRTEVQAASSDAPPGVVVGVASDSFSVSCGSGQLRILELQPESGKRLTTARFLPGHPVHVGDRFDR